MGGGGGRRKYTKYSDWSSMFEIIHTCTWEVEKVKVPPQIQLTVQIQALAYLMGDSSGVGFGSVLCVQDRMIS